MLIRLLVAIAYVLYAALAPKSTPHVLQRSKRKVCCRTHVVVQDIEHFMNAKHAAEAFDMLDADEDGQVSLTDVRNAVTTIFK